MVILIFQNSNDSLFAHACCTMYNREIISSFLLGLEGLTTFIEYLINTLSNSFIIDYTVDFSGKGNWLEYLTGSSKIGGTIILFGK